MSESNVITQERPPADVVETRSAPEADAALDTSQSPENQTPAAEQVYESFDAWKASETSKGSTDTPPESRQPQRPAVDPAVLAQNTQYLRQRTLARYAELDGLKEELLDEGVPAARVERLINVAKSKLNEEHADMVTYGHLEAAHNTTQAADEKWAARIAFGLEAALGKNGAEALYKEVADARAKDPAAYTSDDDYFRKVADHARKGYVPEKEATAREKAAFEAGQASGLKLQRTANGGTNNHNGTPAGSDGRSDEEILLDPGTPIDTVRKILARRNA